MKMFSLVAGLVALLLVSSMISLWQAGEVESQFQGQYLPLYAGVDSLGAIIEPQNPNPSHFFEEKAYWPQLGIETPRTAWEYTQRAMYLQDDVGDLAAAMADYQQADAMEQARSCGPGLPLPDQGACLLILRARLANIFLESGQYANAIAQLEFVLEESPFAPGAYFEVGEAYLGLGDRAKAIEAFHTELGAGTGEDAHAHQPCHQLTHFELGELLIEGGDANEELEGRAHLTEYLRQTLWHCDTSPYKILKARKLLEDHGGPVDISSIAGENVCSENLKGPLNQVSAVPESQITARVGCNPDGTRFIEDVS
jgi:tetratricopeptide (TPR) repeat protein